MTPDIGTSAPAGVHSGKPPLAWVSLPVPVPRWASPPLGNANAGSARPARVQPLARGLRPLFRCPAGQAPRRATPTQVQPASPGFQPWGCKGRSPLHEITLDPPFPGGEGGDRDRKTLIRQENPARKTAVPPLGAGSPPVPVPRWASPRRATPTQVQPAPPGFSPGDARGEAPCIRKLKISPFPAGEERSASAGWGDGGQKSG